jgi:hypothetical protein
MDAKTLHYVQKKTDELLNAPTCCKEAHDAALEWRKALGSDKEKEQTVLYLQELSEDVCPIDDLVDFAPSKKSVDYWGKEEADRLTRHSLELKKSGALYCDCPACVAALAILAKKEQMLK